MSKLEVWLRQPSTINGLAIAAGGIGAALSHLTTGDATTDMIIGLVAAALVNFSIRDHTAPK